MQLSSILPGLRDLRAPLSGGMLWVLAGWLMLTATIEDLPSLAKGWPGQDLAAAIAYVGPIGQMIAVVFTSYLVGIILVDPASHVWRSALIDSLAQQESGPRPQRIIRKMVVFIGGAGYGTNNIAISEARATQLIRSSVDINQFLQEAADLGRLDDVVSKTLEGVRFGLTHEVEAYIGTSPSADAEAGLVRAMVGAVFRSHTTMLDKLLIVHPELFSALDRIRAESDFRHAVAVPTFIIGVILLVGSLPWSSALTVAIALALHRSAQRLGLEYFTKLLDVWEADIVVPLPIDHWNDIASSA